MLSDQPKPSDPKPRAKAKNVKPTIKVWHQHGDKITILHASSRTFGKPPHVVDLESYRCNGSCSCEIFAYKYNKEANGEKNLPNSKRKPRRCEHIKAARDWLLNKFIREIMSPVDHHSAPHNHHP